jgi:hypothetical protein
VGELSEVKQRAIRDLTFAVAMWQVGSINSPVVVDRAVGALVAGLDTPGLRDLAGRVSDENWFEMRDLIEETFSELGAPLPQIDTDASILLALQFMCQQFASGQVSARELAKWAHAHVGHEGPALAQDLVVLDDAFDEIPYIDGDEAEWTERTKEAARSLLQIDVL